MQEERFNQMTEEKTRNASYEAMFLISQAVATDLAGAVDHINQILDRAGAELIAMKKWDERRLAYEIQKQKRGVFILAYFNAPTTGIASIERDCSLSEKIMRVMVLRADHLTEEQMKAVDAREELATEAKLRAEHAAAKAAEETEHSVSIGAPTQEAAAKAPKPEGEPDTETAETPEAAAPAQTAPEA